MPPIIAITSNTKIPIIMILKMVESRNFSDFGADVVLVEFVVLPFRKTPVKIKFTSLDGSK